MTITLVQSNIIWEDKIANIAKAESLIPSNQMSDLILFPEMSFTGFSMNIDLTKELKKETCLIMKDIAKRYGKSLGFGWVKDCGEKCENHYSIIDSDGNTIADYAKMHPFSYYGEDKYFLGGNDIKIFEFKTIPFSAFICYDLRFPELFREVANKVHAVIIPACWPAKRAEHWKALLRARAIENQIYVFAVNCVGNVGGLDYSGDSCVIDPDGKVIEMLSDKEGVITYEFEDDVEKYRALFPVLKDRRLDIYG